MTLPDFKPTIEERVEKELAKRARAKFEQKAK